MKAFSLHSRLPGLVLASGVAMVAIQGFGAPAASANPFPIKPIYTTNLNETPQSLPAGSPNPSSFGYFFDTNASHIRLNALGFPVILNWTQANYPNADKFDVYLWRIDGINQPSLLPCDGSTPYCQVAKVTFDASLTSSYTVKDGFYWQEFAPIDLGRQSSNDANLQYAIAAVGNFSVTDGLPTFADGTGTFDPIFSWTGNGFNGVAPGYTPDFSGDFPVPWNFVDVPSGSGDPTTYYAYFSPNMSYALVPSPLPLLGAGAAFGWARRLRRRVEIQNMRALG